MVLLHRVSVGVDAGYGSIIQYSVIKNDSFMFFITMFSNEVPQLVIKIDNVPIPIDDCFHEVFGNKSYVKVVLGGAPVLLHVDDMDSLESLLMPVCED